MQSEEYLRQTRIGDEFYVEEIVPNKTVLNAVRMNVMYKTGQRHNVFKYFPLDVQYKQGQI